MYVSNTISNGWGMFIFINCQDSDHIKYYWIGILLKVNAKKRDSEYGSNQIIESRRWLWMDISTLDLNGFPDRSILVQFLVKFRQSVGV